MDMGRHSGVCTPGQVRVWVVDDQAAFRRATVATIDATDDFVLAGECATGESAVARIAADGGDIVLMDIHMPGIDGIEAARQICSTRSDVMIVLMSTYDVTDLPAAAADCGAASYLHKEHLSPDTLRHLWQAHG
jgi:two-component system invasion response regulator UvrY